MTERWFMSEEGDEEFGWTWDIKELVDGKLQHICTANSEEKCRHILHALQWVDGLGEFKMGLRADGFIFNNGIPRPKKKAPKVGANFKL